MDSARPRGEDLSTTKARTKYLNLLQLGYYDIVAISALCYFLSGDLGYSAEPRGLARLTTATFLRILLLRWPGLRLTRLFSSLCRPAPIRGTDRLPCGSGLNMASW